MHKLYLFIVVSFFCLGCDKINEKDCACTKEFRMITVEITDSLNRPLNNLHTKTIDIFGNTIIPIYKKLDFFPNHYVVADDSNIKFLSTSPSNIIFIVTDSVKSKSYSFTINTDDCQCHINKLDGPDKIIF